MRKCQSERNTPLGIELLHLPLRNVIWSAVLTHLANRKSEPTTRDILLWISWIWCEVSKADRLGNRREQRGTTRLAEAWTFGTSPIKNRRLLMSVAGVPSLLATLVARTLEVSGPLIPQPHLWSASKTWRIHSDILACLVDSLGPCK